MHIRPPLRCPGSSWRLPGVRTRGAGGAAGLPPGRFVVPSFLAKELLHTGKFGRMWEHLLVCLRYTCLPRPGDPDGQVWEGYGQRYFLEGCLYFPEGPWYFPEGRWLFCWAATRSCHWLKQMRLEKVKTRNWVTCGIFQINGGVCKPLAVGDADGDVLRNEEFSPVLGSGCVCWVLSNMH